MACSSRLYSKPHCLKLVSADEALVDRMWQAVESLGRWYSAADGVTKETLRKVVFRSSLIAESSELFLRFEITDDYVELHPVVRSHGVFAHREEILAFLSSTRESFFHAKPLCCIIPESMKSAMKLATRFCFEFVGYVNREFSGRVTRCSVYAWRGENGNRC